MDIVKKYDYNPPKISNQKFNKYIKELLSSFQHFNDTVEHKTVLRGQREEMIRGPKYKFVGTHTMRRTFVTRCLQNLIPPATVAYWTGLNIQTMYSYLDPAYNAQSYEDMLDL
jgi:integrase